MTDCPFFSRLLCQRTSCTRDNGEHLHGTSLVEAMVRNYECDDVRCSFPPKGSSANAKLHEFKRIKPEVENFHDSGNPVSVVNYPSILNPFAQEHVAMSMPANANYTSPPLQHFSQPLQDSMEDALDRRNNPSQTNGTFAGADMATCSCANGFKIDG